MLLLCLYTSEEEADRKFGQLDERKPWSSGLPLNMPRQPVAGYGIMVGGRLPHWLIWPVCTGYQIYMCIPGIAELMPWN